MSTHVDHVSEVSVPNICVPHRHNSFVTERKNSEHVKKNANLHLMHLFLYPSSQALLTHQMSFHLKHVLKMMKTITEIVITVMRMNI